MDLLAVGQKAPGFKGISQNGETVSLKDLKGKTVVLFFYPKDDTPGCTKEACGFRDAFEEFTSRDIQVIGVSIDSAASHAKFAGKYQLPFTLLADPEKAIVEAYRVWGEKKQYGRTYMGTHRVTYVIDTTGKISAVYPKVKPELHARQILSDLGY